MANLEVKNPPKFTSEIYKTEREDLLTAELENSIKGNLLNNDVFLKEKLQEETSRAEAAEETNKNNLANHVADKANPHKVTKAQVGLGNVNNTADMNKPVSTAQQNAIDAAYQQATGYTDQKIADLIGGAPETLDTLKEVADAIQTNKDVSAALDAAIGKKANQTELDTHTGNNTIHITSQERTNWNDANTKKHTHSNKGVLDKITQALLDSWNAAYTHISDTVKHITAAERTLWNTVSNKVDKVSGKGLSSNDYTTAEKNKLAGIAANANNYAHPTTSGNKHIPAGGSSGQILRWSADGTAVWGNDNNTTYNAATQSASGLMSSTDKKKLDNIAEAANKTVIDSALSSSSTNPVQNKVVKSALDGKANSNHSHNYAGSSSAGGAANSAAKLQTARTVTIGSQSNTFDGSKDISFNEKDMGLLKITHLQGKSASASNPYKEFAKIKCKGGKYYAGSAYTYTSLNFFMIVNHAVGNMGGYYISTTALKEGMNSLVGGSGNVVFASPVLSDTELVITLFSTNASVIITVIHDAANVEVTQL